MKFNSLIKVTIISISAVIFFSGCSGTVQSNVMVFHKLPKVEKETKVEYSFFRLKSQENSLEYDTYKEKIKQFLVKNNYFENENSNLLVGFYYGVDNGKVQIGSMPIYGQTGVSSSYTTGNLNTYKNGNLNTYNNGYGSSYGNYSGTTTGNYSATTTYTPTYGVVGSSTYSYSTYNRFLTLVIFDKTLNKIIYEGKVNSEGRTETINAVIDEMIESLFEEFPGESGKTKKVSRPFVE